MGVLSVMDETIVMDKVLISTLEGISPLKVLNDWWTSGVGRD